MGQVLSQPIQSQLLQRRGNANFKCGSAEMHGFRMNMEDCHTIAPSLSEKRPEVALFAVFDGHAGERAAIFLEAELHKRIAALEDPTNADQLSKCVQQLDADFLSMPEQREDGSTCTFCVVYPVEGESKKWNVISVNVGDSRSFILRPDGAVDSLTEDHKPETEAEMARITTAGGTVAMNRVDGQLAMSRAIGDWQYKANPDLQMHLQKVIAVPDIEFSVANEGDYLVVCCDGIVEQMTNEDAGRCVFESLARQRAEDKEDLARVSWDLNRKSLQCGSKDNHSCMVIAFKSGESYQAEDEFVAGPYHPYKKDRAFNDAYLADAKKHGYEGEVLFEMARMTEAGMPELANMPVAEAEAAGGGGLTMGLQALQALISQPGDMSEIFQALVARERGRAGGEGEAPGGEAQIEEEK